MRDEKWELFIEGDPYVSGRYDLYEFFGKEAPLIENPTREPSLTKKLYHTFF